MKQQTNKLAIALVTMTTIQIKIAGLQEPAGSGNCQDDPKWTYLSLNKCLGMMKLTGCDENATNGKLTGIQYAGDGCSGTEGPLNYGMNDECISCNSAFPADDEVEQSPGGGGPSNSLISLSSSPTTPEVLGGGTSPSTLPPSHMVVTLMYGELVVTTGYYEFLHAAEQHGLSEEELAEMIIAGMIDVEKVEITISGVRIGSTIIDYTLEVSSPADAQLLETAVVHSEAAAKNRNFAIQMGNGENITFPILSNEITDVTPAGPPATGRDDLILGLSLMVILLVCVAAGLWWKCSKSSRPQQGNKAERPSNGQEREEVKVYMARSRSESTFFI